VRLRYEPQHYDALVKQWNGKYTIDDFKTGLMTAVGKFITRNPEWQVWENYHINNGLLVLKRFDFLSQE